jgi:hypothetical protein
MRSKTVGWPESCRYLAGHVVVKPGLKKLVFEGAMGTILISKY